MKIITILIFCLFQLALQAKIDFSLCKEYIETTSNNYNMTGFLLPFSLREDGGIKPENTQFFRFSLEEDSASFTPTNASVNVSSSFNEYNLKLDNGNIQEVSIKDRTNGVTTISFDYNNDKCIPSIATNTFELNGTEVTSTVFDTRLCKEINDFFLSKPKLTECLKADSDASKSISRIYDRHGYNQSVNAGNVTLGQVQLQTQNRYSYSVEQRVLTGSNALVNQMPGADQARQNRILGVLGGNPTISAYMILKDCEEKGLAPTINDPSVWETVNTGAIAPVVNSGIPQ
jgi:hypothetical protein